MPLEMIVNDPIILSGVALGAGAFIGYQLYQKFDKDEPDTIDSEGMETKLKKIFTYSVDSQGSKIYDWVKVRGIAGTPRTIGLAIKGKKTDIEIVRYDYEDEEYNKKESKGYTYRIIEMNKKTHLWKKWIYKYLGIKSYMETWDVPKKLITVGDDFIWLDSSSHFVKFNGVKRHLSVEGLSRGWETSFSKTHENYLETMGDIPEQYAVLNNRISGQITMENIKSENFREFEKTKKNLEKFEAVD